MPLKVGHYRLPAKRHLNGDSLAGRKWPIIESPIYFALKENLINTLTSGGFDGKLFVVYERIREVFPTVSFPTTTHLIVCIAAPRWPPCFKPLLFG